MSNGVPKFLRLKNLEELGIAKTHQAVRHMQIHYGFPLGRLLGPGTRVWTEDEINEWLPVGRSSRPSKHAGARGVRSRQRSPPTARQLVGRKLPALVESSGECAP